MKGFLAYIPGDSPLHRLDPRTKLLLSLLICVACFSGDSLLFLCAMIAVDLAIGAIGGIMGPALRLLRGLIRLSIFLFLLQVLFVQSGTVLLPLPFGLGITDDGLLTAARVALRLIGATLPLSLLISMTKLTDLSNALVDGCRIPYRYAFAVTSAIRFVPTFAADLQAIMEAQTARGVEFDTRNPFKKVALVLPLCVPLLISSVSRTDRAAIAAELRGFNLRGRGSAYRRCRLGSRDAIAIAVGVGLAIVGVVV